MLIVGLLALASSAALPNITVRASDSGYVAKAETFEFSQAEAVEAEIDRRAAQLCAGKDVKWGKFGSLTALGKEPGATPPEVSGFYKEFRCIVAEKPTLSPAPADWRPSATDESEVRGLFDAYYAKRDAGDFDAALAMYQLGAAGEAETAADLRLFNSKLGAGKRRVTAVTWYVNPQSAPQPGVYVALDFIGEYPTMHLYCGYLVFYRRGPGDYGIVRLEQNLFERGESQPDAMLLAQMRTQACRGS